MFKYLSLFIVLVFAGNTVSFDPPKQTFKVCKVDPAEELLPTYDHEEFIPKRVAGIDGNGRIYNYILEASYDSEYEKVYSYGNPFVDAVRQAYASHRPLELSPDMIWLCIAQGFATHVNENAEALRDKFVDFEGKKELEIIRDDWRKGSETNDWAGAFEEFSELIEKNTGPKVKELVTANFSTTGPVEKAAFEVTLMDAMQSYFDFKIGISCGIPEITLTGTPADWAALEKKAAALGEYGLEWWMDALLPVLAEFTKTSKGEINQNFWKSIYDHVHNMVGCGTETYVTGWIKNLFPYLDNKQQNGFMVHPKTWNMGLLAKKGKINKHTDVNKYQTEFPFLPTSASTGGIQFDDFPIGISEVPFKWQTWLDGSFDMALMSGFTGIRQDPETFYLAPEIGWIVMEKIKIERDK